MERAHLLPVCPPNTGERRKPCALPQGLAAAQTVPGPLGHDLAGRVLSSLYIFYSFIFNLPARMCVPMRVRETGSRREKHDRLPPVRVPAED